MNNIEDVSETIAALHKTVQEYISRKDYHSAQLLLGVLQELYPKPTFGATKERAATHGPSAIHTDGGTIDDGAVLDALMQHKNAVASLRVQQAKLLLNTQDYNSALQLVGSLTYFAINGADNPLEALAAEAERWTAQVRHQQKHHTNTAAASAVPRGTNVEFDDETNFNAVQTDDQSDEVLNHLVGFDNPSSQPYQQLAKLRSAVKPRCVAHPKVQDDNGQTPFVMRRDISALGSTIRKASVAGHHDTSYIGFACTQPFEGHISITAKGPNDSYVLYQKGNDGPTPGHDETSISSLSEMLPPQMSDATNLRCEALQVAAEASLKMGLIAKSNIYSNALVAIIEAEEEVIKAALADMGQLVLSSSDGEGTMMSHQRHHSSSAYERHRSVRSPSSRSPSATNHQEAWDVLQKRLTAIQRRKVEPFLRIAKAAEASADCEKAVTHYRLALMIDPCTIAAMEALQKQHLLKPSAQVELIQSLVFPPHLEVIRSMYLLQVPVTSLPAATSEQVFPSVGANARGGSYDPNLTGIRGGFGSELNGTFFIPHSHEDLQRSHQRAVPSVHQDNRSHSLFEVEAITPIRPATVTVPITAEGDNWISTSSHHYQQHTMAHNTSTTSRGISSFDNAAASPQPQARAMEGNDDDFKDHEGDNAHEFGVPKRGISSMQQRNASASAAPSTLRDISAVAPTPYQGIEMSEHSGNGGIHNTTGGQRGDGPMTVRALSLQSAANQTFLALKPSMVGPKGITPSAPLVPIDGIPMNILLTRQARLEQSRNDLSAMLATTTQLVSLYPHDRAALCLHLLALVETRSHAKLFQLGHMLQQSRPYSPVAVYAIGCYYYARSEFEKAGRYFAKATDIDASFAEAWVVLGHCYATLQEGEHALSVYRRAMNMFPGLTECATFFGVQQMRTLSARSARMSLQSALQSSPYDPLILNELGTLAMKERNYDEAIRCLSDALRLLPNMAEPSVHHDCILFNIGLAYRRSKNYSAALHFFELYRRNSPNAAHAHCALGVTYHLVGALKEAIECYHTSLALSPDTFCRQALDRVLHEEYTNQSQAAPSGILSALTNNVLCVSTQKGDKPQADNEKSSDDDNTRVFFGANQPSFADPVSASFAPFNFSNTFVPRGDANNTMRTMHGAASFLNLGGNVDGSSERPDHALYTPGSGMVYNGSEDRAFRPSGNEVVDGVPPRRRRNYAAAQSAGDSELGGGQFEGRGISISSTAPSGFGGGIALDFNSQQRPSSASYAPSLGRRSLPSTEFAHRALDLTTATADSTGPSPTQQLRFTESGRYSAYVGGSVATSATTSLASQHVPTSTFPPAAPRYGSMGIDRSSTSPSGSASGHFQQPVAPPHNFAYPASSAFLRGGVGGGGIPSPSAMLLMEGMRESGRLFLDPSTPMSLMGGGSLARSSGGAGLLRASTGAATVLRGSGGGYSRGMAPSAERPLSNFEIGGRRHEYELDEDEADDLPSTTVPMIGRNSSTMPGPPSPQ